MQYYIDKKDLMCFTYGEEGISSTFFSMIIEEVDGLISTYERDVELIEVPGRDGELLIDNKRKKSKDITVKGHIDVESLNGDITSLALGIEEWLQGTVSYKPLTFSDHRFIYQAVCINQINLSEVIEDLCEFEIKFRVMPNPKEVK